MRGTEKLTHSPAFAEPRSKDHIRAIKKLSANPIVQYYCMTGSADEGVQVWVLIIEASIGTYSVTSLSRPRLTLGVRWIDRTPRQKRPLD